MGPFECLLIVLVAAGAWVLGVLFGRRVRQGESPGMPSELHPHDHDEPVEDVAKAVDAGRHHESDIDKAEEFRDIRRTMGDG